MRRFLNFCSFASMLFLIILIMLYLFGGTHLIGNYGLWVDTMLGVEVTQTTDGRSKGNGIFAVGGDETRSFEFLGFRYSKWPLLDGNDRAIIRGQARGLHIPWWFIAALALTSFILPVNLLFRKRMRENVCRKCGDDLRASKERCPECGTAIAAEAKP